MGDFTPSSIRAVDLAGEGAAPTVRTGRPHRGREDRSPLASFALHATLLFATFCALFPVVWVLFSSFKPGYAIRSSEISLIKDPTFENYRRVLFETSFGAWFLNSVIVAAFTMLIGITMSATAGSTTRPGYSRRSRAAVAPRKLALTSIGT